MYTVDFFLNKFQAIPEDMWTSGSYGSEDKHCAEGFCGVQIGGAYGATKESRGLNELLFLLPITLLGKYKNYSKAHCSTLTPVINDGFVEEYQQPTPKQRILAALYDIKKLQEPIPEPSRPDITKELAVLPCEEKLDTICLPALSR